MCSGAEAAGLTSFSLPISNLAPWSCSRTRPGFGVSGVASSGTRRYERTDSVSETWYSIRRHSYPSRCSCAMTVVSHGRDAFAVCGRVAFAVHGRSERMRRWIMAFMVWIFFAVWFGIGVSFCGGARHGVVHGAKVTDFSRLAGGILLRPVTFCGDFATGRGGG